MDRIVADAQSRRMVIVITAFVCVGAPLVAYLFAYDSRDGSDWRPGVGSRSGRPEREPTRPAGRVGRASLDRTGPVGERHLTL